MRPATKLAARAARSGRSLQEYLRRELIRLASKPDLESVLERLERRGRAGRRCRLAPFLSYLDRDRRQ